MRHWGGTGGELARVITLKPFAAVCDEMLEKSLGEGLSEASAAARGTMPGRHRGGPVGMRGG